MDTTQIKWHNHFNWGRIFLVMALLLGIILIGVAVHNVTGIEAAKAAITAANAGADSCSAAAAAGPADSTVNWVITAITGAIGVLSTLLGLLKAWSATSGGSALDKINAVIKAAPETIPIVLATEDTVDGLLAKLKLLLQNQAADKLAAVASQVRGDK